MIDRDALLSGTRPEINDGRILMTSADGFDGYEIVEYKGMAWGISVRSKDMGQDCAMGCQTMAGGELESYTQLGDESRQRALDRMLEMAERQDGNAVINVTFELSPVGQSGNNTVVVYGTVVIIKPIVGYVPTGALGNIMADMADSLDKRGV